MLAHHLYTPSGSFYKDITPFVSNYRHEFTAFGPHLASFIIETDNVDLKSLYDTMLMMNLVTRIDGLVIWNGFVWNLTLDLLGFSRAKTMDQVYNKVKVSARDKDDGTITRYTKWYEDTNSQALYGIHELVQHLSTAADIQLKDTGEPYRDPDTNAPLWEHDAEAERLLDKRKIPQPTYSGGTKGTEKTKLSVKCVGRATIANRVKLSDGYLTDAEVKPTGTSLRDSGIDSFSGLEHAANTTSSGAKYTISHEIRRIVGIIEEQSGWLYAVDIAGTNDTQTAAGVSTLTGAVDRLRELVQIPDQAGNEYEIKVKQDGGFIYRLKDNAPHTKLETDGWKHNDDSPVGWRAYVAPIRVVDPVSSMASGVNVITPGRVTVANNAAQFGPLKRTSKDVADAIRANREWMKKGNK